MFADQDGIQALAELKKRESTRAYKLFVLFIFENFVANSVNHSKYPEREIKALYELMSSLKDSPYLNPGTKLFNASCAYGRENRIKVIMPEIYAQIESEEEKKVEIEPLYSENVWKVYEEAILSVFNFASFALDHPKDLKEEGIWYVLTLFPKKLRTENLRIKLEEQYERDLPKINAALAYQEGDKVALSNYLT